MEKTKDELNAELNELQHKYALLETKYNEEINAFKKNEEELRLKLMFLEGVANSTIDGFLVVNPYGQKILQNQRTIELWKIPKEVVDDPSGMKQVAHVMHMTNNPQQFVAEIDYLRDHPNEVSCDELELIDGTILDRYSSPVIGPDGINYGRIWTFHDITERKNFEKKLIQLNADKDRFISILAHDLRGPFSSLLGLTGILRKKIRGYTIEKIEKMLDTIYNSAKKTHELLEDTLLWASIQSKKVTFSPSITNLTEVIYEVIEILKPNASAKNITIDFSYKKELLVYIDVYMIKAILRNLISNALKFTKEGGKIAISASQSDSFLTLKISDNGVGISPEVLEKLFSFAPIKSTQGTADESGTGLGLLLCKEFIDKHSGRIWIESTEGKGTIVSFSLPDQENKTATSLLEISHR
jgi:signal transduction histidine kinase